MVVSTLYRSFLVLGVLGSASAWAEGALTLQNAPNKTAAEFKIQEVSPEIYRSSRPGEQDYAKLQAMGIKFILNLESDKDIVWKEIEQASKYNIQVMWAPMSGWKKPKDSDVNRALDALANPSLRPIVVHCKLGKDRTGMVVGLYRVEHEHWSPEEAYQEMKDQGFHSLLVMLQWYYKERTHYEDPDQRRRKRDWDSVAFQSQFHSPYIQIP